MWRKETDAQWLYFRDESHLEETFSSETERKEQRQGPWLKDNLRRENGCCKNLYEEKMDVAKNLYEEKVGVAKNLNREKMGVAK